MGEVETNSALNGWAARFQQRLGLLGHRNWIGIVDAAYPLQMSPGIEMIDTGATGISVLQTVLAATAAATHVQPIAYTDLELEFVGEEDAAGVTAYRRQLDELLKGVVTRRLLHDRIIARLSEAGKEFSILLLKTTVAIPYTSVFLELQCGYWASAAEDRLRASIQAKADASQLADSALQLARDAAKGI